MDSLETDNKRGTLKEARTHTDIDIYIYIYLQFSEPKTHLPFPGPVAGELGAVGLRPRSTRAGPAPSCWRVFFAFKSATYQKMCFSLWRKRPAHRHKPKGHRNLYPPKMKADGNPTMKLTGYVGWSPSKASCDFWHSLLDFLAFCCMAGRCCRVTDMCS